MLDWLNPELELRRLDQIKDKLRENIHRIDQEQMRIRSLSRRYDE